MSERNFKLTDFDSLEQLRDELKLQTHLFRAEAKEEWDRLEHEWKKLRAEYAPCNRIAHESAHELKNASKQLFDTVKSGYHRIKESLPA